MMHLVSTLSSKAVHLYAIFQIFLCLNLAYMHFLSFGLFHDLVALGSAILEEQFYAYFSLVPFTVSSTPARSIIPAYTNFIFGTMLLFSSFLLKINL